MTSTINLVLNVGSSSIKFAVIRRRQIVHRGQVDRLHTPTQRSAALMRLLRHIEKEYGRPSSVAHRIVHGGGMFWKPTRITPPVINYLKRFIPLAPLHMPVQVDAVRLIARTWRSVPQTGVFDTGLYHALPPYATTYSIPRQLSEQLRIRKYGFHGISHDYAWRQAAHKRGRPSQLLSGVTLHLGAGDSLTAWQSGRPIDTSMGFTPLEGVTMATRSGDLDPMVPLYLQTQLRLAPAKVMALLQQQSGLFGLTGLKDIRDVLGAAGHPVPGWPRKRWTASQKRHARLGIQIFIYDIRRYLASYLGLIRRPGVIVFTGAVGQNAWVRHAILTGLQPARGLAVVVIPTDEERAIAEAVWGMVD